MRHRSRCRAARADLSVPVRPARRSKAKVPFPDDARGVAGPPEYIRERRTARFDDERRVSRQHACSRPAPRVLSREHGVARGRAGRRGRMRVGEPETFLRQSIDVRRPQARRAVRRHVAVAKIVSVDEDDVRARLGVRRGDTGAEENEPRPEDLQDVLRVSRRG